MSFYEVTITVRSGSKLVNKKMFEKPATYVKIHVDEMTDKTEIIPDLENPTWNRTFKFVLDHKPKAITFEVKDDRTLLPNVRLGNYIIDLENVDFNDNQPHQIVDGQVELADTTQGTLDVFASIATKQSDKLSSNNLNNGSNNMSNMHNMNSNMSNNNNNMDMNNMNNMNNMHNMSNINNMDKMNNINNKNNNNMNMNRQNQLIITLLDGEGLKKSDLLSQSDPYVKIRIGNEEKKSKTISNNDNPIWNEHFTFSNLDINNLECIELIIMDDDILIDDNIGTGIVDHNQLMNSLNNPLQNNENEIKIPIKLKDKVIGSVRISVQSNNNNNEQNLNMYNNNNEQSSYNNNNPNNYNNYNNNNENNLPNVIKQRREHILPTTHINQQPQIVEEEIIYEKPIEIHSTFVHHEKPVIIEKPIIHEKHEYYRDNDQYLNQQFNSNLNLNYNQNNNINNNNNNAQFLLVVVGAQGLNKHDLLSKSDPYVEIKTNDQKFSTKTVKNTTNPIWNEQFNIFFNNSDVEFIIKDDDILIDDKIGTCKLSADQLRNIGLNEQSIDLPILIKNKEQGILNIKLRQLDNNSQQQFSNPQMMNKSYNNVNQNNDMACNC